MPLRTLECPCGKEYEAIVGGATLAEESRCPACNRLWSEARQLIGAGRQAHGIRIEDLDPEDVADAMAEKERLSSPEMAAKILDGRVRLREQGKPKEFLPTVPEGASRKYF